MIDDRSFANILLEVAGICEVFHQEGAPERGSKDDDNIEGASWIATHRELVRFFGRPLLGVEVIALSLSRGEGPTFLPRGQSAWLTSELFERDDASEAGDFWPWKNLANRLSTLSIQIQTLSRKRDRREQEIPYKGLKDES